MLRRAGYPEADIAERLEFGSVEAMHKQLENWGVPGLLPSEEAQDSRKETIRAQSPHPSRARIRGLPSPSKAAPLFRSLLQCIRQEIAMLEGWSEALLEDDRYIWIRKWHRKTTPREWWELACEIAGADPDKTEELFAPQISPYQYGFSLEGRLVTLIAGCVLMSRNQGGGAMKMAEDLLEKLHPEPEKADREKLREVIFGKEGLLCKARQLADLVRSKPIKRGPKPNELPPFNQELVRIAREEQLTEGAPPGEAVERRLRELAARYHMREDVLHDYIRRDPGYARWFGKAG